MNDSGKEATLNEKWNRKHTCKARGYADQQQRILKANAANRVFVLFYDS